MADTTTMHKSITMLTKLSASIEKNMVVYNRYTDQIEQTMKVMDQANNIGQANDNTANKDNNAGIHLNDNASKRKTLTSRAGQSIQNTRDRFANYKNKLQETYGKPKEGGVTNKILGSSMGFLKTLKNSSIGKGILGGIGKNKEVSKMMTGIKDKWSNMWSSMGSQIAPMLKPALAKISKIMDGPAFKKMIQIILKVIMALIQGATMLLDYLSPIMDVISNIFGVLVDNAEIVLFVLGAVATAILAIAAATGIYNAINTVRIVLEKGLNGVLNANPTMLIIKAVILLIMTFITLIATMEPVRTAIADLTRKFFDFIEWGINGLIEGLASAAEGIIRFAGDGINTFLNIFVNPFIDGVNIIIDGLNLLGASIGKLDHLSVDFSGAAEATGTFIRKGKVDLSVAKEAMAGAIENFSAETLIAKLGISTLEAGTNTQKKDVGVQVNKMNDDVNIEEEDIKLMREVAEREMIQNFVTLTPTVSMGDMTVHENADADKLLGKITEALVTEVANSAQGVYA